MAERFAREGAVQVNSDDYWSPEEREAWDAAIERNIAQRPPRPLRRATRPVKVGRLWCDRPRLSGEEALNRMAREFGGPPFLEDLEER